MGAGAGEGAQLRTDGATARGAVGGAFLERALRLAGARKSDLIGVAGPDALPAMLELCRAGFQHAECARRATCVTADRPRDLLLLAGVMDADALGRTVRLTARLLREGGLLVAELVRAEDAAAISLALAALGRSGWASGAAEGLVAVRAVRRAARGPRAGSTSGVLASFSIPGRGGARVGGLSQARPASAHRTRFAASF